MKRTSYDHVIDREIAEWTGVRLHREHRGKHNALVLTFGEQERFVIYPATPSAGRTGALNCLQSVRKELLAMGAQRRPRSHALKPCEAVPRAERRDPLPRRRDASTRLSRDPWAALSGWGQIR